MHVVIRTIGLEDRPAWARMRCALWPEDTYDEHLRGAAQALADPEIWGFFAETGDGTPIAFAEASIRKYANGCAEQPVAFLEGIWVAPDHRRRGVGRQLIAHASAFFKARGFSELCSDALLDNTQSRAAHGGWGFAETERVIYFRKPL